MFMYKTHAESDSMYNTPPCYSSYMCKLVLEDVYKRQRRYRGLRKRNALQLLAQRTGIEGDLFFFNAVDKEKIEFGIAGERGLY